MFVAPTVPATDSVSVNDTEVRMPKPELNPVKLNVWVHLVAAGPKLKVSVTEAARAPEAHAIRAAAVRPIVASLFITPPKARGVSGALARS